MRHLSTSTRNASCSRRSRLDLKRTLMLHVAAVTVAAVLAASTLVVGVTLYGLRQSNEEVADMVGRLLEFQLLRIESNLDRPERFPDWETVSTHLLTEGQCLRYSTAEGAVGRVDCAGSRAAPSWRLPPLVQRWLARQADAGHELKLRGRPHGQIMVTTEPAAITAAAMRGITPMLALAVLLGGSVCVLLYFSISRSLAPVADVLDGLDRLARGDLGWRLPRFRLAELDRIAAVFNHMAMALQQAASEQRTLAARLVDTAELERRRIARDLHDELSQNLAAMSALAASIKMGAAERSGDLARDAARLQDIAASVMKSLRQTLRDLRPQEIDDLGLRQSLAALVARTRQHAGGRLSIDLEIAGSVDGFRPASAAHVYRIVQEGLANVVKHAGARHARVTLQVVPVAGNAPSEHAQRVQILIEDDGCGLTSEDQAVRPGMGLIGMRERVMALGGSLSVTKGPAGGVALRASFPFPALSATEGLSIP